MKMMMTEWFQNEKDQKCFANYEGLNELFKVHKCCDLEMICCIKVGKVRYQLFQGLAKM